MWQHRVVVNQFIYIVWIYIYILIWPCDSIEWLLSYCIDVYMNPCFNLYFTGKKCPWNRGKLILTPPGQLYWKQSRELLLVQKLVVPLGMTDFHILSFVKCMVYFVCKVIKICMNIIIKPLGYRKALNF